MNATCAVAHVAFIWSSRSSSHRARGVHLELSFIVVQRVGRRECDHSPSSSPRPLPSPPKRSKGKGKGKGKNHRTLPVFHTFLRSRPFRASESVLISHHCDPFV